MFSQATIYTSENGSFQARKSLHAFTEAFKIAQVLRAYVRTRVSKNRLCCQVLFLNIMAENDITIYFLRRINSSATNELQEIFTSGVVGWDRGHNGVSNQKK